MFRTIGTVRKNFQVFGFQKKGGWDWSENQFLAFLKAFEINDYLLGTTWNRRRTAIKEFEIIYELRAISRKFH